MRGCARASGIPLDRGGAGPGWVAARIPPRRNATVGDRSRGAAGRMHGVTQARGWGEMLADIERRLVATTGDDVATWAERVRATGLATEPEVRAWLAEQGVTGYGAMVLVMERFGYPDFLTATPDALIEGQYADKPQLRPVYDAVVTAALGVGEAHVQARKGYVSLVGPRRTFAVVQASTRTRLDLGLRLEAREPG